jgi:hypothetical protein
MELTKIIKYNKFKGYQLCLKGKKYEILKKTEIKEENVLTNFYSLVLPKLKLIFTVVYPRKKGDYWKDKNDKKYYFKMQKNRLVIGKLALLLSYKR